MSNLFDIVIVGGGINGAGIARDAALRGFHVGLFEQGDFGSGTSSKSSKLIHGGLRYLKQGNFSLVTESITERRRLRHMAPHLVQPLPFLVPVYEDASVGLEKTNIGLWLYDALSLFRSYKMHRIFRGNTSHTLEPALRTEQLTGAVEYYDCVTDDFRLVLENIVDAVTLGADCRSYTKVTDIQPRDENKPYYTLDLFDQKTGRTETVSSKAIVVAAGVWTDILCHSFDDTHTPHLRPTKGTHIVFPQHILPLKRALALPSPHDQRIVLAIPWFGRTVVGTTDTQFNGDFNNIHATNDEVNYLCDAINHYLKTITLSPNDIIATWSGVRPLVDDHAETESSVSRDHTISIRNDGICLVMGGKMTTYRLMAEETVEKIFHWLNTQYPNDFSDLDITLSKTQNSSLPGSQNISVSSMTGIKIIERNLIKKYAFEKRTAIHLSKTYGMRANHIGMLTETDPSLTKHMQKDLPYIWGEVTFAVQSDFACHVTDVLSRRIPLLLLGLDQGLDIVDQVGNHMAKLLHWDNSRTQKECDAYRQEVSKSRQYQQSSI